MKRRTVSLRRPPFAGELGQRLAFGWRPMNGTIHIAAGPAAWRLARSWQAEPNWRAWFAIVDRNPCDLTLVRGFDVVLHCCGFTDEDMDATAVDLVVAGAALVVTTLKGRIVSFRRAGA